MVKLKTPGKQLSNKDKVVTEIITILTETPLLTTQQIIERFSITPKVRSIRYHLKMLMSENRISAHHNLMHMRKVYYKLKQEITE